MISDQGREFINQVNHIFINQVNHILLTYHSQTNGMVEHFTQTLQRSLIKLSNEEQNNWDEYIDGVLFAYRTSVHKSTKFTPSKLMCFR